MKSYIKSVFARVTNRLRVFSKDRGKLKGGSTTPRAFASNNREACAPLFNEVIRDIQRNACRRFRYRARPVGFKGQDVLFSSGKKFHRGSRIVRSDGRVYEIYRRKKTKLQSSVVTEQEQAAKGDK